MHSFNLIHDTAFHFIYHSRHIASLYNLYFFIRERLMNYANPNVCASADHFLKNLILSQLLHLVEYQHKQLFVSILYVCRVHTVNTYKTVTGAIYNFIGRSQICVICNTRALHTHHNNEWMIHILSGLPHRNISTTFKFFIYYLRGAYASLRCAHSPFPFSESVTNEGNQTTCRLLQSCQPCTCGFEMHHNRKTNSFFCSANSCRTQSWWATATLLYCRWRFFLLHACLILSVASGHHHLPNCPHIIHFCFCLEGEIIKREWFFTRQ